MENKKTMKNRSGFSGLEHNFLEIGNTDTEMLLWRDAGKTDEYTDC